MQIIQVCGLPTSKRWEFSLSKSKPSHAFKIGYTMIPLERTFGFVACVRTPLSLALALHLVFLDIYLEVSAPFAYDPCSYGFVLSRASFFCYYGCIDGTPEETCIYRREWLNPTYETIKGAGVIVKMRLPEGIVDAFVDKYDVICRTWLVTWVHTSYSVVPAVPIRVPWKGAPADARDSDLIYCWSFGDVECALDAVYRAARDVVERRIRFTGSEKAPAWCDDDTAGGPLVKRTTN